MRIYEVERLARELMSKHNVGHLTFKFDGGLQRIGSCRSRNNVAHTITLSKHWATRLPEEEVRDVILHEIAHAIAGNREGHNHNWKAVARSIGAKPERCKTGHADVAIELAKYHAICDCHIHKGQVLQAFNRMGKQWQRGKVCARTGTRIRIVEVR